MNQKGFLTPLLAIILIIAAGIGGYVWLQYRKTNSESTPAPIQNQYTNISQTPAPTPPAIQTAPVPAINIIPMAWKSYKNTDNGYQISYPADAKIYSADPNCVKIDSAFGFVAINAGSSDPCGQPTGIGTGQISLKESIAIADKQYSASGFREPDNSGSFLSFGFISDDKIFVTYGVAHFDKSNPKSWKGLGALTDSEYQNALNSAKQIVSTLKLLR